MDTKHIQIRDYDYALPDDRIAKFPLPERDASKLLIYDKGKISETQFRSLPSLLPEGSLMVFNNTRVIQARLHFRKKTAHLQTPQTPSVSPLKGEDSGDVTAKEALPLREGLGGSEAPGALIEVFLLVRIRGGGAASPHVVFQQNSMVSICWPPSQKLFSSSGSTMKEVFASSIIRCSRSSPVISATALRVVFFPFR